MSILYAIWLITSWILAGAVSAVLFWKALDYSPIDNEEIIIGLFIGIFGYLSLLGMITYFIGAKIIKFISKFKLIDKFTHFINKHILKYEDFYDE